MNKAELVDRMASALGLPKPVRETAAVIYRKAVDKNLIRGRSIEGVGYFPSSLTIEQFKQIKW